MPSYDAVDVFAEMAVGARFSVQGYGYTLAGDHMPLSRSHVRVQAHDATGRSVKLRVPRHAVVTVLA